MSLSDYDYISNDHGKNSFNDHEYATVSSFRLLSELFFDSNDQSIPHSQFVKQFISFAEEQRALLRPEDKTRLQLMLTTLLSSGPSTSHISFSIWERYCYAFGNTIRLFIYNLNAFIDSQGRLHPLFDTSGMDSEQLKEYYKKQINDSSVQPFIPWTLIRSSKKQCPGMFMVAMVLSKNPFTIEFCFLHSNDDHSVFSIDLPKQIHEPFFKWSKLRSECHQFKGSLSNLLSDLLLLDQYIRSKIK